MTRVDAGSATREEMFTRTGAQQGMKVVFIRFACWLGVWIGMYRCWEPVLAIANVIPFVARFCPGGSG